MLKLVRGASFAEIGEFVEREKMYGLGCRLVDMALLASTLITRHAKLWTLDKRHYEVAARFAVAY